MHQKSNIQLIVTCPNIHKMHKMNVESCDLLKPDCGIKAGWGKEIFGMFRNNL